MTHKTYTCPTCNFVLSKEEFSEESSDEGWVTCPVCWDCKEWHSHDGLCANTRNMIVLFKKLGEGSYD